MQSLKNKVFLFLVLGAAAFLLSLSLGGEFLHGRMHHHISQEEHDDCQVYQLMTQLFTFVAVIPIFFAFISFVHICILPQDFIQSFSVALPALRAPPVSL